MPSRPAQGLGCLRLQTFRSRVPSIEPDMGYKAAALVGKCKRVSS